MRIPAGIFYASCTLGLVASTFLHPLMFVTVPSFIALIGLIATEKIRMENTSDNEEE